MRGTLCLASRFESSVPLLGDIIIDFVNWNKLVVDSVFFGLSLSIFDLVNTIINDNKIAHIQKMRS